MRQRRPRLDRPHRAAVSGAGRALRSRVHVLAQRGQQPRIGTVHHHAPAADAACARLCNLATRRCGVVLARALVVHACIAQSLSDDAGSAACSACRWSLRSSLSFLTTATSASSDQPRVRGSIVLRFVESRITQMTLSFERQMHAGSAVALPRSRKSQSALDCQSCCVFQTVCCMFIECRVVERLPQRASASEEQMQSCSRGLESWRRLNSTRLIILAWLS